MLANAFRDVCLHQAVFANLCSGVFKRFSVSPLAVSKLRSMVEAGKFDDEINRFIKEVDDSVEEDNRASFDEFMAKDFQVVQSALEMTKEEQDAENTKAAGGGSAAENAASSCSAHLTDEEWFIQRMEFDMEKLRRLRRTYEAKKNDLNKREA